VNTSFLSRSAAVLNLVAFLVVILVGFLVIRPLNDQLKDLNTKIAVRSQENEQLTAKLNTLQSLRSRILEGEEQQLLASALPINEDVPGIYVMIPTIATKSGVTVESLQVGKATEAEVPVDLTITGEYQGLLDFFGNLHKNQRPIRVRSIAVSARTDQESKSFSLSTVVKLGIGFAGQAPAPAAAPASENTSSTKQEVKEELK
jgi:Tfp pilus assembly protein PilO